MAFLYLKVLAVVCGQCCAGRMNIDPVKVFPVTLTYGKSKPADLEFLNDIVEDLNLLMNSGLKVGDKNIKITLKCHL